ncbi:MAG TPA: hypothetical protein VKR05_01870 [Candidatus Cybelea sp.]|nr:hypothetical protein [Candidatus Cybelea sp.]
MTLAPLIVAAGCGHGGAAAGPAGWQPMPGASAAWTTGSGANSQEYHYVRKQFGGTLQDLASAVTIDVLLRNRGAKLQGSVPFAPCPGTAAVATFTIPGGKTLEEGFAARDNQSVQTTYVRPSGAPADPAVAAAMQSSLCIAPA